MFWCSNQQMLFATLQISGNFLFAIYGNNDSSILLYFHNKQVTYSSCSFYTTHFPSSLNVLMLIKIHSRTYLFFIRIDIYQCSLNFKFYTKTYIWCKKYAILGKLLQFFSVCTITKFELMKWCAITWIIKFHAWIMNDTFHSDFEVDEYNVRFKIFALSYLLLFK